MAHSIAIPQIVATTQQRSLVPVRRWHPSGHRISIWASLLAAAGVGLFFLASAGWMPADEWRSEADFALTWLLLTYIWVQMGSLIVVGAGSKNQMWVDALSSIVPLFLIVYVLLQHYGGYIALSSFQARAAWVTAYTMLLDLVVDLGVTILLSRQVVDIGDRGVAG